MPQLLRNTILDMNLRSSQELLGNRSAILKYRDEHPTSVAEVECMDGRVDFRLATETPLGIISTICNIGGKLDVGWPALQGYLNYWQRSARKLECDALLITTYHWSDTSEHLGCRGFGYDKGKSIRYISQFRDQVARCYAKRIWAIMIGIETDSNSLLVHAPNGDTLDMRTVPLDNLTPFLKQRLGEMFPDFPEQVLLDLLPFLLGNVEHLRNNGVNKINRFPEHRERVIAVGDGFNWFRNDNLALMIGTFEPDLRKAIVAAAGIIQDNLKGGRITVEEQGMLLVSTPYSRSVDKIGAEEVSKYLVQFAFNCIEQELPEMKDFFHPLVGVVNEKTQLFAEISE